MTILIGDVHGCYKTLLALLKKLPDDKIIFVGDLVDRGPRAREVVQLLIDHPEEMQSVMGNHEQVMLGAIEDFSSYKLWVNNPRMGGIATALSYCGETFSFKLFKDRLKADFSDHFEFISRLPMFIEEKDLFVSHSYYNSTVSWDKIESGNDSLMWNRYDIPSEIVRANKKMFHVFGHTPEQGGADISHYYANIDTGGVFNVIGLGFLTALHYPSMEIFVQDNID